MSKSPKKAPKKVAKKSPGHHDPHRDARRAFEHLGRVLAIASLTQSESATLSDLTRCADLAFRGQHYKTSADLLRAAEHLSFASLNNENSEHVAEHLKAAIKAELDNLLLRAEDHAPRHLSPDSIRAVRDRMTESARTAFSRGSYRAALEYARGAEALAHIHDADGLLLQSVPDPKRLREA